MARHPLLGSRFEGDAADLPNLPAGLAWEGGRRLHFVVAAPGQQPRRTPTRSSSPASAARASAPASAAPRLRPNVAVGDYFQCKPWPTRITCKAYTQPRVSKQRRWQGRGGTLVLKRAPATFAVLYSRFFLFVRGPPCKQAFFFGAPGSPRFLMHAASTCGRGADGGTTDGGRRSGASASWARCPTRCFTHGRLPPHPLNEGPPLSRARCFTNLAPGTFIGPVEEYVHSNGFATVLVRGYWINVWACTGGGVHFARRVPDREIARWRRNGWFDALDAAPAG